MGATLTLRSSETLELSVKIPIFPGFSVTGVLRDFWEFRGVYELPRGHKQLVPRRQDYHGDDQGQKAGGWRYAAVSGIVEEARTARRELRLISKL